MDTMQGFDPSAGTYVKGIKVREEAFLAVSHFHQLKTFARDPQLLQAGGRRRSYMEDIEDEVEVHELIQRALTGNKKSNVPRYRDYIADVVDGKVGVLPPIHLWSEQALNVVAVNGNPFLVVPFGMHLLAIDGETQLAAHFDLQRSVVTSETKDQHGKLALMAVIHHGVTVRTARQYFHDLNVLAVRPNTSLGLSMDTRDPFIALLEDLESSIDFLRGRVDKQARQLRKRSDKVITMQTLRQMVINIAKGISGIQYGARPVPTEDLDLDDLKWVSLEWLGAFFNTFGTIVAQRDTYIISASPVLAAVGAMGNQIVSAKPDERTHVRNRLLADLQSVDWKKGQRWSGIAGRVNEDGGNFIVGGTKEVAYAVYNVLANPDNDGFRRVRGTPAA